MRVTFSFINWLSIHERRKWLPLLKWPVLASKKNVKMTLQKCIALTWLTDVVETSRKKRMKAHESLQIPFSGLKFFFLPGKSSLRSYETRKGQNYPVDIFPPKIGKISKIVRYS